MTPSQRDELLQLIREYSLSCISYSFRNGGDPEMILDIEEDHELAYKRLQTYISSLVDSVQD